MNYDQTPGVGLVGGKFVGPDPGIGQKGTQITPLWLNGFTDEHLAVLTAAGITPNHTNTAQLLAALRALGLRSASTEQTGVSELATNAEALTGSSSSLAITAAALAHVLAERTGPKLIAETQIAAGQGIVPWTTIDLAATVPGGARTAIATGVLEASVGDAQLFVRADGDAGAGHRVGQVAALASSDHVQHASQFLVPLSTSRRLQFRIDRTNNSDARAYQLLLQGYYY